MAGNPNIELTLLNQGVHPEVAAFVHNNFNSLKKFNYTSDYIIPEFIFAAEMITESQVEEMSRLKKFLKGNEVLGWESEGDRIGSPFKIQ